MLDKKNIQKVLISSLFALIFLNHPTPAHAWSWRGDHYPSHHSHHFHHSYPVYGEAVFSLPHGVITIAIGGLRYHYCDGVFYRRMADEYVVVSPPAGAVVRTLPPYYEPVIIDGTTYYSNDGIYYKYTRSGYAVIPQPRSTVLQTANVAPDTSLRNTGEAFTVNIPNAKGGYTTVALKRSGDGFIGPQGEFYPEFPRVEQLRVMYAQ